MLSLSVCVALVVVCCAFRKIMSTLGIGRWINKLMRAAAQAERMYSTLSFYFAVAVVVAAAVDWTHTHVVRLLRMGEKTKTKQNKLILPVCFILLIHQLTGLWGCKGVSLFLPIFFSLCCCRETRQIHPEQQKRRAISDTFTHLRKKLS